jgi:hypothetical protein
MCIKIKQIAKQEIESIVVADPRRLLRLALASLFESSRISWKIPDPI